MELEIYGLLCEYLAGIFVPDAIHPIKTGDLSKPNLVYEYYDDSAGTVHTGMLTLKIISPSYHEAACLSAQVKNRLNTDVQGQSLLSDSYAVRSLLAGGGCLYNSDFGRYEYQQIYTIRYARR